MKKIFPIFIIVIVLAIFFRQLFLQGFLPIPSDTIIGLYNPFRDLYAKEYPRGIPFKNFLITDPVRQQYPWRFESILQEKNFQLPLWNPYNFAGNPLLANQQSASLTPFNLFFFFLPFPITWSLLIFLQPVLGGFFMFLYLRNLKLRVIPGLLGSIAFIFSGFFIAWLEWGTIDATALWLPLILLAIDKVFTERRYIWYGVYFLANIIAFFSGHLQTFIYMVLLAHAYMGMRLITSKERIKTLFIGLPFGILAILVTAIQWLPLSQFILLSARDSDLVMKTGWFIPYQHLITFFVPDFFGNPATLNYWGVWNYGELAGYVGVVPLFFALFAVIAGKSKNVLFFLGVLLISLLFALPTFFAQLPLAFHIPFLATTQPTRLMVLIDFSLCVLSAIGVQTFLESMSKKVFIVLGLFFCMYLFLWIFVVLHTNLISFISLENISVAKHNLVFPTSIFAIFSVLLFGAFIFRKNRIITYFFLAILLLSVFDNFRFADKFTPFAPEKYLFPSTKSLQFLMSNIGNERIMATDNQILPPNFSLIYHLQDVAGYDPLYIKSYGEYVAALERNNPDTHTPFGFNRLLTPQNYESRLFDLLGVKYVLSLHQLSSPKLKQVYQEGQTIVYENKNVFPRAFFAESVTDATDSQQAADFLFNSANNLRTMAAVLSFPKKNENFSQGEAIIQQYSAEKILLQTKNNSEGFLVLTDSYYPTWHAYVDGKEVKIYQTDLAFRGIIVPSGSHKVTFTVQLW